MLAERLRIELSKAYRHFGDSETDIDKNVDVWIKRLTNNKEEFSIIELTDGTKLKGVDIYVAVRVPLSEEFRGNEETLDDDYTKRHMESCVILVTKEDIVVLKHEYEILDDIKDVNLQTNHKFKKAELAEFNGKFSTIWP